ncbi:MAG: lysine 2,3-aminomutase [Candidatus Dadabacteria bacterium]|nr:MAG: lysine 2,3-aminomutase [Candidatus Dadabacteria bacterium]
MSKSRWGARTNPRYKTYTIKNIKELPQIDRLSKSQLRAMEVVSAVLPFRTNNYVTENLINWDDFADDPMFILNFPQKDMLKSHHFRMMEAALAKRDKKAALKIANQIRYELNPHPAGQLLLNTPVLSDGTVLMGLQHKYRETVLFFPLQGQTCHAYCTFCFRWPQFVGLDDLKFGMKESELLVSYLREHKEVSDVLFTGGDPMVMKARVLERYIDAILDANLPHVQTIRIGTKALSYWPYRFTTDSDADDVMRIFEKAIDKGKHVAIMAHFTHPVELRTDGVREAIKRLHNVGIEIRCQAPLLRHINDSAGCWADMWREEARLGAVPYFTFVPRDTGAQHYFSVPLAEGVKIFQEAMVLVSGIGRTVRGFSMSATPGKVQVLDVREMNGEKVFVLRMLQGRNPEWCYRVFFAKYDPKAIWLDDLKPAFGEKKFFYEDELSQMIADAQLKRQAAVGS